MLRIACAMTRSRHLPPGPPGHGIVRELALTDVAGNVGQPAIVITRVLPQQPKRLVYRRGQVLGEHSLGLLDDHAGASAADRPGQRAHGEAAVPGKQQRAAFVTALEVAPPGT